MRWLMAMIVVLALAGCSADKPSAATIDVDHPVALFDQALHLHVTGLRPRAKAVLSSTAANGAGQTWRGTATVTADGTGTIDLDTAAPSAGSYSGVGGMGLFWSMTGAGEFVFGAGVRSYTVHLAVSTGAKKVASRDVVRRLIAPGVTGATFTVAADKVAGSLFLPPPGTAHGRPVLVFTGSDGAIPALDAADLAAHGHPALAIGYFKQPGLPPTLQDVPLEYFVTAAKLLQAKARTTEPVVVDGYSRGSEAALLVSEHFPQVFQGTLLYAPNDRPLGAYPGPGDAWTLAGKPIATGVPIPTGKLSGPVLAIAGGQDTTWDSVLQAKEIKPARVLEYPQAGHGVGTVPYVPTATAANRQADERARADGWLTVLTWLGQVHANSG